jgi:hypothetical protein
MANTTPEQIRFKLPKDVNENVYLITWNYVVSQMTEFMETATNLMQSQNTSLEGIIARVDEWLAEQGGDVPPNP